MLVRVEYPLARTIEPNMGFSLTGLISGVASAPFKIAAASTHEIVGAVSSITGDAFHLVGTAAGGVGGAAAAAVTPLGGALQSLRPQAPAAPSAPSSLPLILGGGAVLVVLLLLLTGKKAPASSAPVAAPPPVPA